MECVVIAQPALSCSDSGNVAAGKEYDHVPDGLEYPREGRSGMDRDLEGQ